MKTTKAATTKIDPNAAKKRRALGPNAKYPHGIELTAVADGHVSFERYAKVKERDARLAVIKAVGHHHTIAVDWSK
jgi:hypothetical protein